MRITDNIIHALETEWEKNGDCGSCSWHSAFYQVKEDLIEQLLEDDFEIDKTGEKYIVAYCQYATDNDEDHRTIKVYIKSILDASQDKNNHANRR